MEYLSSLSNEDTDVVLAVINRFSTLWHTNDAEKFGEIFTDDAEFTDIINQIFRGKNEIIDQHRFTFTTVNRSAEFKISKVYMRSIANGLVLATGDWTLEKTQTPKGDPIPYSSGFV